MPSSASRRWMKSRSLSRCWTQYERWPPLRANRPWATCSVTPVSQCQAASWGWSAKTSSTIWIRDASCQTRLHRACSSREIQGCSSRALRAKPPSDCSERASVTTPVRETSLPSDRRVVSVTGRAYRSLSATWASSVRTWMLSSKGCETASCSSKRSTIKSAGKGCSAWVAFSACSRVSCAHADSIPARSDRLGKFMVPEVLI